jgi:hypothetical protein
VDVGPWHAEAFGEHAECQPAHAMGDEQIRRDRLDPLAHRHLLDGSLLPACMIRVEMRAQS